MIPEPEDPPDRCQHATFRGEGAGGGRRDASWPASASDRWPRGRGRPRSRADNEVVTLAALPLDAVERVDVYRGTTPLAFAQSGPGGVVNVITRRPDATPLTAASASYGSFDTRKVDLVRSARLGAW